MWFSLKIGQFNQMIAYITIGSPLILLGKPHQFFNVFEITRTNGSLILILFLPTNWN